MTHTAINAEHNIQQLVYRIVTAIDAGQASLASAYFTDDGVIKFGGAAPYNSEFSGIENIRLFFKNREENKNLETRHLISNLCVSPQQDGSFRANYLFNVLRGTKGNTTTKENLICDVSDQFRLDGEDFKIFHRHVKPIFIS